MSNTTRRFSVCVCVCVKYYIAMAINIYTVLHVGLGDRGSTVLRVLCYKSEGRWFDPSWNFSLT